MEFICEIIESCERQLAEMRLVIESLERQLEDSRNVISRIRRINEEQETVIVTLTDQLRGATLSSPPADRSSLLVEDYSTWLQVSFLLSFYLFLGIDMSMFYELFQIFVCIYSFFFG